MLESLRKNSKGIMFILISASCLCLEQLLWKIMGGYEPMWKYIMFASGFLLAGLGGIAMLSAYRCGELSVIQPMNSISYVFSTILSVVLLSEPLTIRELLGIVIIITGVALIGGSSE